ncbi:hypothetical protein LWI29_009574 [Acer saccharum]|uniref:SWIM-type domain-containing protein n=1 Tax=Acer saccharum TaxID=4024 RepID=A0AA39RPM3_ACESA|nr:hypothetical protein LWI29_009574 [Acer saccharum]
MDVLALFEQNNVNKIHFNVEYISVNVVMPSDSDDQSSYNDRDVDDGNVVGEEHNDGPRVPDVEDNDNELDGLSDVNEDNISQEVVLENGSGSEGEIDQPNRGTTFTLGEDGRIKLEYHTLYRAKRFALKIGDKDQKESYNKLYRYGGIIIERNPGSYAKLSMISYDPNLNVLVHFHRFYLSFYAQKKGYLDGCRPFLGLDGCHLKGPYEGILLCAVAIEANSWVFPIALGVVEIESLDSWTWFIQLLYEHVGMHEQRKVCFMSDQQKGIIPALDAIWPNHHTRFCGRHILQNLMSTFKVEYLRELFWLAARSSNLTDFVKAMAEIKEISEPAHQYLLKIPLEYWTVHAFDTITKTDHNTNNVVDAFNGWLNKYRAQPLLTMMENKTQQKGRYLDPLRCDQWEFEVVDGTRQFVVKLDDQTCQCGIWAVSGIPCKHAMACITRMRQNVEDYVHEYLKKLAYLKTYSNAIHAISDESLWPEVEHGTVLPPLKRRRSGRSRLSRRRGVTEPARVKRSMGFRCSKCQEVGYNSRTCKAPVQRSRTEV